MFVWGLVYYILLKLLQIVNFAVRSVFLCIAFVQGVLISSLHWLYVLSVHCRLKNIDNSHTHSVLTIMYSHVYCRHNGFLVSTEEKWLMTDPTVPFSSTMRRKCTKNILNVIDFSAFALNSHGMRYSFVRGLS